MSILKMRKWVNKGADKVFYIGLIVILLLGMTVFFSGGGQGRGGGANQAGPIGASSIMSVNGKELTYGDFLNQYDARNRNNTEVASYYMDFQNNQQALNALVQNALISQMEDEQRINPSDADSQKFLNKQIDQQIDQAKRQFLGDKFNAPDANAQFDAKLKDLKNPNFSNAAQFRAFFNKQAQDVLKDDQKKQQLTDAVRLDMLQDKYRSQFNVTDADAMARYQQVHAERIVIPGAGKPGNQAETQAKDVAQKIKSGMSFEEAIKKYSLDPIYKQKNGDMGWLSKESINQDNPYNEYKALAGLKAGQVSDPVKSSVGPTDNWVIYKVVGERTDPKFKQADFDKQKADIIKEMRDQKASAKYNDDLKKRADTAKITYSDPGFEALYRYGKEMQQPTLNAKPEDVKKTGDALLKLLDKRSIGNFVGLLKYMIASQLNYNPAATPADKDRYAKIEIDALKTTLVQRADPQLRLLLARLYVDQKQNDLAKEQYQKASQSATIPDQPSIGIHQQIAMAYDQMGMKELAKQERIQAANLQKKLPKQPNMPGGLQMPPRPAPRPGVSHRKGASAPPKTAPPPAPTP